jgi:RimJ/RimL family protein N-acetyltransferase
MAAARSRDRETFDAHWARVLSNPDCIARVIVDAEDRVLGGISCFVDEGVRHVGYWIGKEHWGRGVASAAVALLLDEVKERPIHARVARDNVASIKVLERNGFVVIGYVHAPETERFLACEEALLRLE